MNDNDNYILLDDLDDFNPETEEGPFVLVFFDEDGYQNGLLGPFADMNATIEAATTAMHYAIEHGLPWPELGPEIVPCSDYF